MRSIPYIILLLVLTVPSLHAQRRKPHAAPAARADSKTKHQLLWEISGNGLKEPSYLYGTMHVQDRRAFEFSDSVLVCFGRCNAFAAEMRLDSALRELLVQLFPDDADTAVEAADIESTDDEAPNSEPAGTEPADDEATDAGDDGSAHETFVPPTSFDSDDSTVESTTAEVDAKTYDDTPPPVAPDADAVAVDVPDDDPMLDGDPGAIADVAPSEESDDDDADDDSSPSTPAFGVPDYSRFGGGRSKLSDIYDNPLMSDFFTSSSAGKVTDRPMFLDAYLTGLALRAGKQVIGLETMDEQLEAAKSMKSMVSGTYSPNLARLARRGFDPDDMIRFYRAGNLEKISGLVAAIFSPEAYSIMIVQRNYRMAERAERFIRQQPTFVAIGAGHLPGARGVIQLLRDRGFTVRPVKATFTGLVDSFVAPTDTNNWPVFSSARGAFTARLPMEPIRMTSEKEGDGEAIIAESFIWPDLLGGVSYIVGYSHIAMVDLSTPAGETLRQAYQEKSASALRTIGEPVDTVFDGMPALEFTTKETSGKYRRTRLMLRGSRIYSLVAESTRDMIEGGDAKQFFESFHPIAPLVSSWRVDTLKPGMCLIEVPAPLQERQQGDSISTEWSYWGGDVNSGVGYTLSCSEFSPYFRAVSEDSLMALAMESETTDDDPSTIEAVRTVARDGIAGREYTVRNNGYARRVRMMLVGPRLYTLRAEMPAEMLDAPDVDRYFDAFRALGERAPADLYSDKSAKLFDDLASSDEDRVWAAREAARSYLFVPENLPRMHQVVSRPQPDDTYDDVAIRAILLERLGTLNDAATVPVIGSAYPGMPADGEVRKVARQTLINIGTDEALDTLAALLARDPNAFDNEDGRSALYLMDYTTGPRLYPRLFRLLEDSATRSGMYHFIDEMLDAAMMDDSILAPHAARVVSDTRALLAAFERRFGSSGGHDTSGGEDASGGEDDRAGGDDGDNTDYVKLVYCARILGHLPATPEIDSLIRTLIDVNDINVALQAVDACLRHDGTPSDAELEPLAYSRTSCTRLYDMLDEHERLDLFPEAYRTQRHFAESLLYGFLSDEYGIEPDTIAYVAYRAVRDGDEPGMLYLFKFKTADGPWTAALSGPQPLDEHTVNTDRDFVRTDFDEFSERSIGGHFRVLMKR